MSDPQSNPPAAACPPTVEELRRQARDRLDEIIAYCVDDQGPASFLEFEAMTMPVAPSKGNEGRASRAVEFDRVGYRRRSIVECLIGWLKKCRPILTRFQSTAKNYGGMVKMGFIQ